MGSCLGGDLLRCLVINRILHMLRSCFSAVPWRVMTVFFCQSRPAKFMGIFCVPAIRQRHALNRLTTAKVITPKFQEISSLKYLPPVLQELILGVLSEEAYTSPRQTIPASSGTGNTQDFRRNSERPGGKIAEGISRVEHPFDCLVIIKPVQREKQKREST